MNTSEQCNFSLAANDQSLDGSYNPYAHWGGFSATLGALPDAASATEIDPVVRPLLQKLDAIDRAPRTFPGLLGSIFACRFTAEQINRLNSPLLDGLMAVIRDMKTLDRASDRLLLEPPWSAPATMADMIVRGVKHDVDLSTFQFLLQRGADIRANDNEALVQACNLKRDKIARFLLEFGASPNARKGLPLVLAASNGSAGIVSMFLQKCMEKLDSLEVALFTSVKNGHTSIAAMLLVFLNTDKDKDSAFVVSSDLLCGAVTSKDLDTVALLLNYKADVHAKRERALRIACAGGNVAMTRLLLDHGAAFRLARPSAFNLAAAGNHVELLELLLSRGFDNQDQKDTALLRAVKQRHVESVKLLLANGSNVSVRTNRPLRIACKRGYKELVELLLKHGADPTAMFNRALILAASGGFAEIVAILLRHGADVHAQFDEALMRAVENSELATVALLHRCGADVHAQNNRAISHALDMCKVEILLCLLRPGP